MSDKAPMEAYMRARLRADEPKGGWPNEFGVVTACNPDGVTISDDENGEVTRRLELSLLEGGKVIFPVTGYDPDSDHGEPGFGVVCGRDEILELGRKWDQLAVFWVDDGDVWLLLCEPGGESILLRPLLEMVGEVPSGQ